MIPEGARVSYVGNEVDSLVIGDVGRVLSDGGSGSHVIWQTGVRKGEITLEADVDLIASNGARISYDDCLDSGLVTVGVRDTFDSAGAVGLLNALNDEGHLATFSQIAEEAMRLVSARIREDPSFSEVLSHLDVDEGADLVSLATTSLLHDAFGSDVE